MLRNSATLQRLVNSARATLNTPHKQVGEDLIDWMHRLAKTGRMIEEIVKITGVSYVNVEYWAVLNGYADSPNHMEHLGKVR